MGEQLTPQQVVAWFRSRADRFGEMADEVERTFNLTNGKVSVDTFSSQVSEAREELAIVRIKNLMADGKSRRVADISTALALTEHVVRAAVYEAGDDFELNERGWISMKET